MCVAQKEGSSEKLVKAALVIAIYVDDGLACCSDKELLNGVVDYLKTRFEITVMNPECFVGLQIKRDRSTRSLFISQEYYIHKILQKFGMLNAKSASTPADSNITFEQRWSQRW